MNLINHLYRMREFSFRTFGPGERASGIVDHIRKELVEIEEAPKDLKEWVDVAILALDGAWRAGHTPEQIAAAIEAKQTKNEGRKWPDWRTAPEGEAIEHIKPALAGTKEFLIEQETVPNMPICSNKHQQRVPGCPTSIPFTVLNSEWAQRNHGQTLATLARRGGLGVCEAVAIIQQRPWHRMLEGKAVRVLNEHLEAIKIGAES